MVKDLEPRRAPSQARGERRVATLLDAAAALFAEIGYAATTTNAIAARAGASVASLYQFFPHKEAIAKALADRYLVGLGAVYDSMFTPDIAALPVDVLVDRLLDPLFAYTRSQVGFHVLFGGTPASGDLAAAVDALDRDLTRRLASVFALRAPHLTPTLHLRRAMFAVRVVKGLFPAVMAVDPVQAGVLVDEMKLLLAAYFREGIDATTH